MNVTVPEEEMIDIITIKPTTALDFLVSMRPAIPYSKVQPCTIASNNEIRRWLKQSAVLINGVKPQPFDVITFPVTSLIFFPKNSKMRSTVI